MAVAAQKSRVAVGVDNENSSKAQTLSFSSGADHWLCCALKLGMRIEGNVQVRCPATSSTVVVAEVTRKTVPIYSEFVGQTKADDTVELRARVEGILLKTYFREGSTVRKGQLLFTIDKRPFEAALQSARALLAKSESDLAQARQRTDVLQAQAELADAQAY